MSYLSAWTTDWWSQVRKLEGAGKGGCRGEERCCKCPSWWWIYVCLGELTCLEVLLSRSWLFNKMAIKFFFHELCSCILLPLRCPSCFKVWDIQLRCMLLCLLEVHLSDSFISHGFAAGLEFVVRKITLRFMTLVDCGKSNTSSDCIPRVRGLSP